MERYNYKGKEIIGIDHGFGNIKCRHVAFRSGVRAYDSEPPMTADVLIFGGKYYVVGEEHKGFVSDRVRMRIIISSPWRRWPENWSSGTLRNARRYWRWGCPFSGSARRRKAFGSISCETN